jgi:hypothetical protein
LVSIWDRADIPTSRWAPASSFIAVGFSTVSRCLPFSVQPRRRNRRWRHPVFPLQGIFLPLPLHPVLLPTPQPIPFSLFSFPLRLLLLVFSSFLFSFSFSLVSFCHLSRSDLFLPLPIKSFSFLVVPSGAKCKSHPVQLRLFGESKAVGVRRLEVFRARCERSKVFEQLRTKRAYLLFNFVLVKTRAKLNDYAPVIDML